MPRILYIEDNAENRMLVRRVLMASDRATFEVSEADDAMQGIAMAEADPPDIILMDLSMPNMDGLTATRHLRTMPHLNHIPIVALTANAMHSDRERSLSAGCDGYIRKPIDVDKFPEEVLYYVRRVK